MTTTAVYPSALFTATDPLGSTKLSDSTPSHSVQHTNLNDEVAAIEATLGTNPLKATWTSAVAYGTVAARLAAFEVNATDFGVVADNATNSGDAMGLAIAFCLATGARLRLPAGKIIMRTAAAAVKKITIDFASPTAAPGAFEMYGQGMDSTQLIWNQDVGTGAYGITVSNPTQTAYVNFHDFSAYNTQYNTTAINDPNATAVPTTAGAFLLFANRSILKNFAGGGWRYCIVSDGVDVGSGSTQNTDHTEMDYIDISCCYFGIYFLGNGRKSRDYIIRRATIHGCQRAAFGVAANGEATDVTFDTFHVNACPFGFWKEGATPSDTGYLANCHFIRCKFEGPGNGYLWAECTDGSGDVNICTGMLECQGVETNGQLTGVGGSPVDHGVGGNNHSWRPYAVTSVTRDGGGTVTGTIASAPSPALQVGDSFVLYVSDNHTLNSSQYGGFNIKSIVGTTYTWEQTGAISTAANATAGPCVGFRAGSFVNCDLVIAFTQDPTSALTHPECNFDVTTMDSVTLTTLGGFPPAVRISGSTNGRKLNAKWRRGNQEAFLCQAAGTFAAGNIIEAAANGNCVKSTLTTTVPCLGVALSPGATTISVASQVVTWKHVWIHSRGRNSTFSFGGTGTTWGPGVIVTSDPGSVALLCEDAANHGQAIACPLTAGTTYRIIGRSNAASAGGFVDYVACDPYLVKL